MILEGLGVLRDPHPNSGFSGDSAEFNKCYSSQDLPEEWPCQVALIQHALGVCAPQEHIFLGEGGFDHLSTASDSQLPTPTIFFFAFG